MVIDVENIVKAKKEVVKEKIKSYNIPIKLGIIQVGNNPASNAYIKGKIKDCNEVGIIPELLNFEEEVDPIRVLKQIGALSASEEYKGIIVQLPLPDQFTDGIKQEIINMIPKEKDVDGFRADSYYLPCTPKGILTILKNINIPTLTGKVACVIGRSEIVGKPMVKLLIEEGCTVISCNSHTVNLDKWINNSDIIISAVGKPNFLSLANDVSWHDKIVIDVGINRDANGKLCGDCSRELYEKVNLITPVPRGVGLATRLSLLENLVAFK